MVTAHVRLMSIFNANLQYCLSIQRCCRCSESAVTATSPPYPPCRSPSASRLAPTSPISQHAAPLHVVRQALERALLQSNDDFWDQNPTKPEDMAKQCPKRRGIQAMQVFLRLHILIACQGTIMITTTSTFVASSVQTVRCCIVASWNRWLAHTNNHATSVPIGDCDCKQSVTTILPVAPDMLSESLLPTLLIDGMLPQPQFMQELPTCFAAMTMLDYVIGRADSKVFVPSFGL